MKTNRHPMSNYGDSRQELLQAIQANAGELGLIAYRVEEQHASLDDLKTLQQLLDTRRALQAQLAALDDAAVELNPPESRTETAKAS